MSRVRCPESWGAGAEKIAWAQAHMPVLNAIAQRFEDEKPLSGLRVTLSIHLEAKTAWLAQVLQRGGAAVAATGCNPLSTQDDVAAALARSGVEVFAWYGATPEEYEAHLGEALGHCPHIIIDDGGDLTALLHGSHAHLAKDILGGCEETTTGVHRLRQRAETGGLRFPMLLVNDADCKHLFDNRYGTGQSVWDGIMRTTNLLVAGKTVVVAGYGWCGRGIAARASGMGARVVVTEVNPVRAIEAAMDGYAVMPMDAAASLGDFFVTATGCSKVITKQHFEKMKDGAVLCNAGHFDVEVDKNALEDLAASHKPLRKNIEGYFLPDGRVLCVLAEGRLVNLAAGDGHPAEIMDMSFAIQALAVEYMAAHAQAMAPGVYPIPQELDQWVAALKLKAMGSAIDSLTPEQERYLAGYEGEET